MLTIVATGERESDLFRWAALTTKKSDLRNLPSIDSSLESGKQKLQQKLQTIGLFSEASPFIVHFLELTPEILALLGSYNGDIYVISPSGKLPKKSDLITIIEEKVTDVFLKGKITDTLRSLSITPDREQQTRMYIPLTVEDYMGKEHLSPLRCMTFLRQLKTLEELSPDEAQKNFSLLIGLHEGKANQWDLLSQLFSTNRRKQQEYFKALTEIMSPYEMMSLAKSSLLLLMALLVGRKSGLDSASIAKKVGKHPFYVGSLLKTADTQRITYEKAERVVTRLMNLELALKSGKFEDEGFGFEILLATL